VWSWCHYPRQIEKNSWLKEQGSSNPESPDSRSIFLLLAQIIEVLYFLESNEKLKIHITPQVMPTGYLIGWEIWISKRTHFRFKSKFTRFYCYSKENYMLHHIYPHRQ